MQNYSKAGEEQSENESFCLSSEVSKVTEAVESTGAMERSHFPT